MGSTSRASVSPAGDVDFFIFRSERGVRYSFELIYGTAGAVSLTISGANGGPVVARNFGEGTDVIWIAPDDGDYVVAVSGSPRVQDTTGTYSLKIGADMSLKDRHGGDAGTATKVVLGNTLAGAVSPADEDDYFFLTPSGAKNMLSRLRWARWMPFACPLSRHWRDSLRLISAKALL